MPVDAPTRAPFHWSQHGPLAPNGLNMQPAASKSVAGMAVDGAGHSMKKGRHKGQPE